MAQTGTDRAPVAERAAFVGHCEQCGNPVQGRRGKRFCRDACRTKFSRARQARELRDIAERLVRWAHRLDPEG
jgi:predicted nucleic acid-binding Zn ribbon protein